MSGKRTGDIEMHAQTRGAEGMPFSFKPATGIHDIFSTVLWEEECVHKTYRGRESWALQCYHRFLPVYGLRRQGKVQAQGM